MTEEVVATAEVVRGTALTKPARFAFDPDQIATIKRTVAKDCTDSEFQMFMEVLGRHGLDPFVGQIYAAKMPARDGQPGGVAIIVSRDGLLAIANREPSFNGMDGDVVRAGDRFTSKFVNGERMIEHIAEGGTEHRGAIIGAWAMVHREGRRPTYFFAPFDSYKTNNKTWSKYPDAMILKVAESMALRKAFSITGVVGEGEMDAQMDTTVTVGEAEPGIDWGPEPFATYLRLLFAEANRVSPDAFRPRKIAFKLAGIDDAERAKIARDVEAFILRHSGTVPTPEDVQAAIAADAPEEEIADAEIVPEDAA